MCSAASCGDSFIRNGVKVGKEEEEEMALQELFVLLSIGKQEQQ